MSLRLGAAIALMAVVIAAGTWLSVARRADCSLPWSTMAQLRNCAAPTYKRLDSVNIFLPSKDPARVAAALADAYLKGDAPVGRATVWAYAPSAFSIDSGPMLVRTDSGYAAEFRPGFLHFDVCTSWDGVLQMGGRCMKGLEFDVPTVDDSLTPRP